MKFKPEENLQVNGGIICFMRKILALILALIAFVLLALYAFLPFQKKKGKASDPLKNTN